MPRVATEVALDPDVELNDGEFEGDLFEKRMSARTSSTEAAVIGELVAFVRTHRLGTVFSSSLGYRVRPDLPEHLLQPDISFVAADRLPTELPDGFLNTPPDLAIEILSPGDLANDVQRKIRDYSQASVRLTWIVFPGNRHVRVYRDGHETRFIDENGSLDGEDVIPGLSIPLASVLPARR